MDRPTIRSISGPFMPVGCWLICKMTNNRTREVCERILGPNASEPTFNLGYGPRPPRPGGGGVLATDIVSKAAPDGYTLILVSPSHVINPALHPKLPFDSIYV